MSLAASRGGTGALRSVLAFDIGGSSTKIGCVREDGALLSWRSFRTEGPDRAHYLGHLREMLGELSREAGAQAVGIAGAVAGFLTGESLFYNPNLAWLEGVDIGAALRQPASSEDSESTPLHHPPLHGLPLHLESDSNAACAGEFLFGVGAGSSRFLCLTGGTGLGVGMVAEGRLMRPAHGCMGDAGHVIVEPGGPACPCGGHGCAEAVLSTAALAARYAAELGRPCNFRELAMAATNGEPRAFAVVAAAGYHLGIAAASLAQIFFPDRIAIAGGLSHAGPALLRATTASFHHHCGTLPAARVSLQRAEAGSHASLLGAAACFFLARAGGDARDTPAGAPPLDTGF